MNSLGGIHAAGAVAVKAKTRVGKGVGRYGRVNKPEACLDAASRRLTLLPEAYATIRQKG